MSADVHDAEAVGSPPHPAPPEPRIADGADHRLDPRVVPLQRLAGWIVAAATSSGLFLVFLVSWVADGPTLDGLLVRTALWVMVTGLLAWRAHGWPPTAYRHTSYRIDDLGIEIRRGVFWRVVINVPLSRVQHTDVAQGPLERRFGLGTLVIYTAGTDHAKVSLSGLEHTRALRVRQHLLPGEGAQAGGDAV